MRLCGGPRKDPLEQFTALRTSIAAKRTKLVARLAELAHALGVIAAPIASPVRADKAAGGQGHPAGKVSKKRAKYWLALKEAVLEALSSNAVKEEQILAGVTTCSRTWTAHSLWQSRP